ncbi:MAG: MOSC domain-containing protein [Betaproteobacteria bacterium]|nr:MOSC domain-containing protein [Betaproteobacteria bacterium]
MTDTTNPFTVLSVNCSVPRPLMANGRKVMSAIGKIARTGAVAVRRLGLDGDDQADPSVHGGLDKAVYAYPQEHYAFWQTRRLELGLSLFEETLPHGFMGENLTLHGLLEQDVWVGDELHFAGCVLRVTEPRQPCFKFNSVMGFDQASRDMVHRGYCGFYLAVKAPGQVAAGESFKLVFGPRNLSIREAFNAKRIKHLR